MEMINQILELKKPIKVFYSVWGLEDSITASKILILRSGKPHHIIADDGEKYNFEYIVNKDKVYRTIIRNLMYKDLIK